MRVELWAKHLLRSGEKTKFPLVAAAHEDLCKSVTIPIMLHKFSKKKKEGEFPLLLNATAKMNFLIALTVLATISSSSSLPGPSSPNLSYPLPKAGHFLPPYHNA
jgi:hypothetical protein